MNASKSWERGGGGVGGMQDENCLALVRNGRNSNPRQNMPLRALSHLPKSLIWKALDI